MGAGKMRDLGADEIGCIPALFGSCATALIADQILGHL